MAEWIQKIFGGVILNILEDLDMPTLERQILGRFLCGGVNRLDVMIVRDGKLLKVIRYKK